MKKIVQFLTASILFENPALSLFVGITPLLASSTTLLGGVFMGISALLSICASCVLFRLLKKLIPDSIKDIVYILIVACVISIIEMLMHAFLPSVYEKLGIYLPLLSVGGLVFSRSLTFSKSKTMKGTFLCGLSTGIGYLAVCVVVSFFRELLGAGTVAGFTVFPDEYAISHITGPVGGFMFLGLLIAIFRHFFGKIKEEEEI